MLVTRQLTVAFDLHVRKKILLWKSMSNVKSWLPAFFKIFCVQQKKDNHAGLEQLGDENDEKKNCR